MPRFLVVVPWSVVRKVRVRAGGRHDPFHSGHVEVDMSVRHTNEYVQTTL